MTQTALPQGETRAALRTVALAGNPNCGKTTLFNALTGLRQRVGNYAGVTVERREGRLAGTDVTLVDLPGTYSLTARSPDEEVARDVLLGAHPPAPELVVVVADASNLERNLYLLTQVMDLGLPVVLCLNMVDVAAARALEVDAGVLEAELGVPVVPTVASRAEGVDRLKQCLLDPPPAPPRGWALPPSVAAAASGLEAHLAATDAGRGTAPPGALRFRALQLLELAPLEGDRDAPAVRRGREQIAAEGLDPDSAIVEARYDWIQSVCDRATRQGEAPVSWSERLDRVATHRVWGLALFFLLMALMFQAIHSWAQLPMGWIETGQGALSEWVAGRLPDGDLRGMLVDGVIGGVGGVVIFLPQIVFLFLFLGLLEDSGYMARAAFVMDRVMGRVGLHGKSFIPLLSSFACAIPGIMAARTIENPRDRLVTILVAPLMSCSARLPVYTLLIAGFIPPKHLWGFLSLPALTMVSMYGLGIVAALLMAGLLKGTLFRGEVPFFLMELPPYRVPSPRTVLMQTWERSSHFIQRAGTIILAISILMWFAMNFPGHAGMSGSDRLRGSVAGVAGRAIEPLVRPFGMDWKVGIGILGSFAARELFVSTMATVYNVEEDDEAKQAVSVRQQMRSERDAAGRPRFTALSAIALMVFYVLALQCLSTLAVVRRETGSWKWVAFQWTYMALLAWGAATLVYQGGRALGLG